MSRDIESTLVDECGAKRAKQEIQLMALLETSPAGLSERQLCEHLKLSHTWVSSLLRDLAAAGNVRATKCLRNTGRARQWVQVWFLRKR